MLENERFRSRGRELQRDQAAPVTDDEDLENAPPSRGEDVTPKLPEAAQEVKKADGDRDL